MESQNLHDEQPPHVFERDHAVILDAQDPLHHLRNDFYIPTKAQLKAKSLSETKPQSHDQPDADINSPSIYLCGNSLGLQPKITSKRIQQYLATWQTQGVYGHFKPLEQSPLPTWLDADARAAESIAPIVGALTSEVAVMETLTANLHFLMSAFYKPDITGRHKIIIEAKAFPSDHYAVESQILHHNLDPATSMITIDSTPASPLISSAQILNLITLHASTTSLLLLPGIQFYTGQLLDIPLITHAAHAAGIFVIWDLAHAIGNVPLHLHDWDVDAAVWCSYKYLNAGPGSIGGLFIHERNSRVTITSTSTSAKAAFPNRLSGWWGDSKSTRFKMTNTFVPVPGAAGFQLSNPSILDITSLSASLEVFAEAGGMVPLREKSVRLTAYLEMLLLATAAFKNGRFSIITPTERGCQLSLRLLIDGEGEGEGLLGERLEMVMNGLERAGVVVDERKPDVVRVAPTPLYNSFEDVWEFVRVWNEVLEGMGNGTAVLT